jgi:hypothetical protein
MRHRRFAGFMVIVTACALATSGCTDDPPEGTTIAGDDTSSTSASPSSSVSASASPTAAETEEMRFVGQFVEALNKATAGGDTKPFLGMCTSTSESCAVAAKSISEIYTAGGSFDGGPDYRLGEWALKPTGDKPVKLQAYLSWNAYQYTTKQGAQPKSGKAGNELYEFHLVREGSTWKVQEYFVP